MLFLVGKFATYYSRLLMLPLIAVVCVTLSEREASSGKALNLHRGLLVAACLTKLPVQHFVGMADWGARDYDDVKT